MSKMDYFSIKKLVAIANKLDSMGMVKEAGVIDDVARHIYRRMKRVAQQVDPNVQLQAIEKNIRTLDYFINLLTDGNPDVMPKDPAKANMVQHYRRQKAALLDEAYKIRTRYKDKVQPPPSTLNPNLYRETYDVQRPSWYKPWDWPELLTEYRARQMQYDLKMNELSERDRRMLAEINKQIMQIDQNINNVMNNQSLSPEKRNEELAKLRQQKYRLLQNAYSIEQSIAKRQPGLIISPEEPSPNVYRGIY